MGQLDIINCTYCRHTSINTYKRTFKDGKELCDVCFIQLAGELMESKNKEITLEEYIDGKLLMKQLGV